jgi:hypothetical protein
MGELPIRLCQRWRASGVASCLFLAHLTSFQRPDYDVDAVLDPLTMGFAEDLLDVSALPVTRLSVGLVVIVLPRSLPSSAELLDFYTDVFAFLAKPQHVQTRGSNQLQPTPLPC